MKGLEDNPQDCKHRERGDDLCWHCEEGTFNDGSQCDYCYGTGTIEVCDDCGEAIDLGA